MQRHPLLNHRWTFSLICRHHRYHRTSTSTNLWFLNLLLQKILFLIIVCNEQKKTLLTRSAKTAYIHETALITELVMGATNLFCRLYCWPNCFQRRCFHSYRFHHPLSYLLPKACNKVQKRIFNNAFWSFRKFYWASFVWTVNVEFWERLSINAVVVDIK